LLNAIGKLGKTKGMKSRSKLFRCENEAKRYIRKEGGDLRYIGIDEKTDAVDYDTDDEMDGDGVPLKPHISRIQVEYGKVIYLVQQNADVPLVDGFLPIQHMIYDMCRIKIALMCRKVEACGVPVIAVKTDCVMIKKSDYAKLNRAYPEKKDIDPKDMNMLGRFKREKATAPQLLYKYSSSRLPNNLKPANLPVANGMRLKDEYCLSQKNFDDYHESNQMIDTMGDRVFLKAKYPGSGKTFNSMAYAKYCMNKGLKVVVCCPQNSQAIELSNDYSMYGIQAITFATATGCRVDDGELIKSVKKEEYPDVLIIDEFCQLNVSELSVLQRYMKNVKKVVANGDTNQLAPIQQNFNTLISAKEYYSPIHTQLFPNQLRLNVPKRYDDTTKEMVIQLTEDCFGD
jgi:hypothetical protein